MKILLTNDDGFEAEGMQCFYEVLKQRFDCWVVAPDQGRSCCGHAVTTGMALDVTQVHERGWAISGTPADCVRVGLLWLKLQPDIVLSGVNQGGNLGVDILYSGTVAAAREARSLGKPSIAFSQYMRRDIARDWKVTSRRAVHVLDHLIQSMPNLLSPASGQFWNVNLPAIDPLDNRLEFPISRCRPEPKPLTFSFGGVEQEHTHHRIQTVLYQSNYAARPRDSGSDVELCFSGHATLSQLTVA
jgi:5'-nucleotidase